MLCGTKTTTGGNKGGPNATISIGISDRFAKTQIFN